MSLIFNLWISDYAIEDEVMVHQTDHIGAIFSLRWCYVLFSILYCLNEIVDSCPSTSLTRFPSCSQSFGYLSFSNIVSSVVFACHLPEYLHTLQCSMCCVYPASVLPCLAMIIVGITSNWWWSLYMRQFQDAVFWACAADPLCHSKP